MYATLSHTWGDDEILFQDVSPDGLSRALDHSLPGRRKEGLAKVMDSCHLAQANGYEWIWINTCCIDKSSSAELSEAINSMFRWYAESAICYAYLSDVHGSDMDGSRWFRRGWTLQELIAPPNVEFFDASWNLVGDRNSLAEQIARISGIDESVLRHGHHRRCARVRDVRFSHVADIASRKESSPNPGHPHQTAPLRSCNCNSYAGPLVKPVLGLGLSSLLAQHSVATRMSWASKRQTTREEDMSYCLLGLFNVNMPLIYGEGEKAFSRLLEEVMQRSNDQSILTWQSPTRQSQHWPVSPESYPLSSIFLVAQWSTWEQRKKMTDMIATPHGLQVDVLVCTGFSSDSKKTPLYGISEGACLGVLDCTVGSDVRARPAMVMYSLSDHKNVYYQEGQPGFTYIVQMQDGTQKLSKTGELFALHRDGHLATTGCN